MNDMALGDWEDIEQEDKAEATQEYLDNELPEEYGEEVKGMSEREWDRQQELVEVHLHKAEQSLEYGKFDDFELHLTIAKILREGLSQDLNNRLSQ